VDGEAEVDNRDVVILKARISSRVNLDEGELRLMDVRTGFDPVVIKSLQKVLEPSNGIQDESTSSYMSGDTSSASI
jgi:hypothetical protein